MNKLLSFPDDSDDDNDGVSDANDEDDDGDGVPDDEDEDRDTDGDGTPDIGKVSTSHNKTYWSTVIIYSE